MSNHLSKANSTDDLMKLLLESGDIKKYIEKNNLAETSTIAGYLESLLQQKGEKKAKVIEKAGIDRVYGYEIFRGKKTPGRDTILRLLLSLNMRFNDIQQFLKNTQYPILYPRNIRDSIIIYGIQKSLDVVRLNILLYDFGQKTI
jgi:DNA-binding phage protein